MWAVPFARLLQELFSLTLCIINSGGDTDTADVCTQPHRHCLLQEPTVRRRACIDVQCPPLEDHCEWAESGHMEGIMSREPEREAQAAEKPSPPPQCDRTSSPLCRWRASVPGYRKPGYGLLEKLN